MRPYNSIQRLNQSDTHGRHTQQRVWIIQSTIERPLQRSKIMQRNNPTNQCKGKSQRLNDPMKLEPPRIGSVFPKASNDG
eukprot:CAMPEP_0171320434 /NCGR_PEP_ID=MMETSP0816-20121228/104238_1 /TAXON_ID=420281 /ORGANISM="Proboscia inermis, Strain CCAP1064/1" /LENGTH=79 /DNA_ID=CAMNT_0011817243 /DNA_START=34 /DNA_END=269 /DNA_ORIENTATION=-